jgi:hypothetical protein
MTDTPPPEAAPVGTGADAIDAGQARDRIENAAYALLTAALIWYALHGDEEPDEGSLVVKTARRLAHIMWLVRPRLSSSKPPKAAAAEQEAWIAKHTGRVVKDALDDVGAHFDTVFKRMTHDDPTTKMSAVQSALRMDSPWAKAAARSAATRLSAETAIDMQPDVEAFTGEAHHLMWISRGDPKVRALHRTLHGRVRPPGTPFHKWPDGQELNYPGDPKAPVDAWINCRCALLLVPAKDAAHAEAVFHVPDADFDVPMAASARLVRAEQDLRAEKVRRYTTRV